MTSYPTQVSRMSRGYVYVQCGAMRALLDMGAEPKNKLVLKVGDPEPSQNPVYVPLIARSSTPALSQKQTGPGVAPGVQTQRPAGAQCRQSQCQTNAGSR